MTLCISLAAFRVYSLPSFFAIFSILCLAVGLFGLIMFGTLCVPYPWISISSGLWFGKVSAMISSNKSLIPFSLSSSGTLYMIP